MSLTFRLAWLLVVFLVENIALGQSRPVRLPPPAFSRRQILQRPASAPATDIVPLLPPPAPWYRRRPALWPEFACGATVPQTGLPSQVADGTFSEPNNWLRVEYLQFYLADAPYAQPLVATSNPVDQGRLGAPSTTVLFGGQGQNMGAFSGLRVTGGGWFNRQRIYGAEASAFVLPTRVHSFQIGSDALPGQVLALPYTFNLGGQAAPASVVLAQPGVAAGHLQIQQSTIVWGVEANAFRMVAQSSQPLPSVSALAGVRFLQLGEHFLMNSESVTAGATVDRSAAVQAQSSFFGFQVGGRATQRWGRLSFQATGKTAFGATSNLVTLNGRNNGFNFGNPAPSLPADLRRNYLYDFSVVPEAQVRLSYDVRPDWRLSAGYDFMYWTRVLRASNQLDTRVNAVDPNASLTAPLAPIPADRHSNFWLHGWNVAVEWIH